MANEEAAFQMPKPFQHELINFYDEGNPVPTPAWVQGINPNSIDVVTITNRMQYAGVRHVSDPGLTKNDDRFVYKWDYTDTGKLLRKLEKECGYLLSEFGPQPDIADEPLSAK